MLKDTESLRKEHADEQDRLGCLGWQTRVLSPPLLDEPWLWKCVFQRRHVLYLVHRPRYLLGRILGSFVREQHGMWIRT